ncbi:MAG: hypothetical protein ACR2F2_10315 [Pyrinomonadaceae bacterium]
MKKIIITFGLLLAVCAIAFAQSDNSNKKILFKAGTEFSAQIENGLNAEESIIGEDLNFTLTGDFVGDGHTVSKGSELYGRIVNVEKASDKNEKTSRISVMFDFVKDGDDFVPLSANIVSIENLPDKVKFESSPTFEGGTVISAKGTNLKIDKGAVFSIKLAKDITEK